MYFLYLYVFFFQGVQCKDCKYNAHKKCSEKVPRDCTGEIALLHLEKSSQADSGFDDPSSNVDDSDKDRQSPTKEEEAQNSLGSVVMPKEFDSDGRVAVGVFIKRNIKK